MIVLLFIFVMNLSGDLIDDPIFVKQFSDKDSCAKAAELLSAKLAADPTRPEDVRADVLCVVPGVAA